MSLSNNSYLNPPPNLFDYAEMVNKTDNEVWPRGVCSVGHDCNMTLVLLLLLEVISVMLSCMVRV